ncbi:MAG: hypothetical protein C5B48_14720 [Candidatus Rokuibacteriota bacterium]|nr:MAG: hypothetical protein C5B48_14720 [Candidatus Rokubacteria bacterium]
MLTTRALRFAFLLLLWCWPTDRVLAQPRTTDQIIQLYQSHAAKSPRDIQTYNKLGVAYIQKARETGDFRYYDLAEQALQHSLELGPDPVAAGTATSGLALVSLGRHQFRAAVSQAEKALAYGPTPPVYAIVGDAYVEMGEYEKASGAYSKMLAAPGSHPESRLWYLQFLRGDPEGAIQEVQRTIKALTATDLPRGNVAWTQVQLGDLFFQVGDIGKSEKAYRDALLSFPGYHLALAGLARVQAAQKRYQDAVKLYEQALAVIPLPEYVVGLGDVYTKMGRPQEAKRQYDLVQYIGTLNSIPHTRAVYNRELALFFADHDLKLRETLERAERELDVRWDIFSYDLLAWALYKNGKLQDARSAMTEALKLGTKDARLFFHAGMIHRALGDRDKAREYLQRALATNSSFHLLQVEVAERTLKELGQE